MDGRSVHVKVRFENLVKLAWSDERNCLLYRCQTCGTFWESCAYEKAAREISGDDARRDYPKVF
jgi:uncharacterized Zn finger protein